MGGSRRWLVILAACLCVMAPAFGHGGDSAEQRQGKPASVRLAEELTQELLSNRNALARAGKSEQGRRNRDVNMIATERHDLMRVLLESNPQDLLRLAIPGGIRAAFPATAQRFIEREVSAEGELTVIHMDMPGDDVDRYVYTLKTKGGERNLHFAGAPTRLLTGSKVRVKGLGLDADIVLANGGTGSVVTLAAALPNTLGVQNTLLIMVNFSDQPTAQPFTPGQASAVVFGDTSNYDLENSYQQTSLAGSATPWYTIATTSTTCDPNAISSQANAAATAGGYTLSNYKRLVYAFPGNTCTWWGLGTIGGNPSKAWINSKFGFTLPVVGHEMGHNFGLYHSHSLDCGANVVGGSECTMAEYGDVFDIMGGTPNGASAHFNAFQKEQLGWLNAGISPPLTTIQAGAGQYSIGNLEAARSSTPRGLKIGNTRATCNAAPSEWYYVEKREGVGFDSFLNNSVNTVGSGVVVHRVTAGDPDSSYLLDFTPQTTTWHDVTLQAGSTFTDPVTGLIIQPSSVGTGFANVNVSYAAASCANPPAVRLTPTGTQWKAPGEPATFSATVTNTDSCGCPNSSYSVAGTLPAGWTGSPGLTAAMAPGASVAVNVGITPAPNATAAFYQVPVLATDVANPAKFGSTHADISVVVPTALANNQTIPGISANKDEGLIYSLVVPPGRSNLSFNTFNGTGDADMYVRVGSVPSTTSYTCASTGATTTENCSIGSPQAGTWYVLLHAYSNISGVSISGSYTPVDLVVPSVLTGDEFISEGNSGSKQLTFTLLLSGVSSNPVSVDLSTAPGTATPGIDYTSTSVAGLTVPAGQTSATFSVPILGDTTVEGNETFVVDLSNPVNATLTNSQARARINNDDLATISIGDASVVEGNSGVTTISFPVRLSAAMPSPVTFDVSTGNGTATGGTDFVARTQNGRFIDAGRTNASFEVQVTGDTSAETDETLQVVISNIQGAVLGDINAVGTIVNDDAPALAPQSTSAIQGLAPARPGARKASARAKTGVGR